MIIVGMDMHVRNSYLHVTDDAGNVMRRGRYLNTLMDLAAFTYRANRRWMDTKLFVRLVVAALDARPFIFKELTAGVK